MAYEGQRAAAKANAAAAADQAQVGQLQAQNVDVQKQQLALQTQQQQLQIQTQKSVIAEQSQADALRQQAVELDATRRRREAIRQGIIARAQSLTAATNQGANAPGSTAVTQAANSISGQVNTNVLGVNQNLSLSEKLFDINKNITNLYLGAQDANSSYVAQSQALQNQVLDTQKQIYALGGDASSNYATAAMASGNSALGSGIASLGMAAANAYPTLNRITNYFGGGSANTGANTGGAFSAVGNPNGYGGVY
jgi:hypothetical protein